MQNIAKEGIKVLKAAEHYTYTQIRCCLVCLLFVILSYNSFAVTACVSNDTSVLFFDADIVPYSGGADSSTTWHVKYNDYSKIQGISACLSVSGGYAAAYTDNNGVLIDNGNVVVGGEHNGLHCWCKIIYPFVSFWVSGYDPYGSTSDCTAACAQRCAYRFYDALNTAYRKTYFRSTQN